MEKTRFYQASTSELFGQAQETPQKETTPFYPRSPYACAKLYSYWITVNYREAYGIFGCNGILFNHESSLRGETFVTRKITRALARIVLGLQDRLYLGNLNAKRDWGHAKDFVEMQWMILQHDEPDDYVIATGEQHSVRDFVVLAAREIGIEIKWKGKGLNEEGYVSDIDLSVLGKFVTLPDSEEGYLKPGAVVVAVDPDYFRPTEVASLLGDSGKAREKLGWEAKIGFEEMVREMVTEDLKLAQRDELCKRGGFKIYEYNE